jgi:hypothetical protein
MVRRLWGSVSSWEWACLPKTGKRNRRKKKGVANRRRESSSSSDFSTRAWERWLRGRSEKALRTALSSRGGCQPHCSLTPNLPFWKLLPLFVVLRLWKKNLATSDNSTPQWSSVKLLKIHECQRYVKTDNLLSIHSFIKKAMEFSSFVSPFFNTMNKTSSPCYN